MLRLRTQGVGDELSHVAGRERLERDLLDAPPGVADLRQRPDQRMRGAEFVVAIGADQEDVPHIRIGDQVFEQFQGRSVQPLQIVQEQRERMLWLGENAEEPSENHLESIPRLLRRKIWGRGLLPDDGGELGNQSDHELAVRAERLEQLPPTAELRFVPAKDAADETLKRLSQGRVRNVALELIEFSSGEQASRQDQQFVQLVDDRGLADAGHAGHQHELDTSPRHHPIESFDQSV